MSHENTIIEVVKCDAMVEKWFTFWVIPWSTKNLKLILNITCKSTSRNNLKVTSLVKFLSNIINGLEYNIEFPEKCISPKVCTRLFVLYY